MMSVFPSALYPWSAVWNASPSPTGAQQADEETGSPVRCHLPTVFAWILFGVCRSAEVLGWVDKGLPRRGSDVLYSLTSLHEQFFSSTHRLLSPLTEQSLWSRPASAAPGPLWTHKSRPHHPLPPGPGEVENCSVSSAGFLPQRFWDAYRLGSARDFGIQASHGWGERAFCHYQPIHWVHSSTFQGSSASVCFGVVLSL